MRNLAIDPRWRVVYLATLAIGVFAVKWPLGLLLIAASQALLWLVVGLPPRRLLRQVGKLWGFAAFVMISYALTADDPAIDRWRDYFVFGHRVAINLQGIVIGGSMLLRVVAVILGSQVARAGDGRAIASGLGKLGVPVIAAASIDAVLALLGGGGGGGGGGGRGRGGGRGGRDDGGPQQGFWATVKSIGRGEVDPITHRIQRQIQRAEEHAAEQDIGGDRVRIVRDVSVIAGVSLTMLGIKALKILPSVPFAPGHKLVILTPLYIVASILSRSRFGATLTGLTMGTVAFLLGDGRYGIFEIIKHVTPGVLCDLLVPLVMRGGRTPGRITWSLVGGVIGAGRFATILCITLIVQAPAVAYAILVPGLVIHTTFGLVSGYVSHHLVASLARVRKDVSESIRDTPEEPSS